MSAPLRFVTSNSVWEIDEVGERYRCFPRVEAPRERISPRLQDAVWHPMVSWAREVHTDPVGSFERLHIFGPDSITGIYTGELLEVEA